MAINQIDTAAPIESLKLRVRRESEKGQAKAFERLLQAAADSNPSDVTIVDTGTTAEILRLQMMWAALSSSDTDSHFSPLATTDSITKAITLFKAHEGEPTVTLAAEGDRPAPEAVHAAAANVASPDASLADIINRASRRYNVDAGLIKAVIKAESNFDPRAVSHAGAQGLMQLMPATAKGLGVTDSFDAEQNVMAGTRFLRDMLKRYGGNVDAALAAYNWGPGNVDRRGGSLPRETRDYLVKVKKYYQEFTA